MKRKTAIRSGILLTFLCGAMLILCSCGSGNETTSLTDEEGNKLELTLDQLTDDGFYVLDKEAALFSPVMGGYEGSADGSLTFESEAEQDRYVWFGSKNADLMSVIPKVDGKNTFLVMLQEGENGMPEEYYVEKYKPEGYTLCVSFTFGETGDTVYIDSQEICESSMAKDVITDTSSSLLKVHKINNSEKLPMDNIDVSINKLLGLEKNKKYQVGYFDGTEYKDVELLADTALFRSNGSVVLNDPLEYTEYGFAYITLPENLSKGYYDINGAGLFLYSPPKK